MWWNRGTRREERAPRRHLRVHVVCFRPSCPSHERCQMVMKLHAAELIPIMRDFVHRFYPYQALKLLIQRARPPSPRRIGPTSSSASESPLTVFDPDKARAFLVDFFRALKEDQQDHNHGQGQGGRHLFRHETSLSYLGFALQVQTSKIPQAGLGVFLNVHPRDQQDQWQQTQAPHGEQNAVLTINGATKESHHHRNEGRSIPPGTIVGMYPGLLYRPGEAILFNSIQNRYILKCNDGIFVDAKSRGLSGYLYRSVNARDNYPGITPTADTTWMFPWATSIATSTDSNTTTTQISTEQVLRNPLAVGQIVNNGTRQFTSNVRYQELDFRSKDCPLELQEFLPNLWHAGDWHSYYDVQDTSNPEGDEGGQGNETGLDSLRTVVLVTTREMQDGEELYSTYIE